MAAREHQGYQIALVIFVMLTVLLSITTFMFFKKYREEQQKNTDLAQKSDTVTAERTALDGRLTNVLPLVGFTKEEPLDAIAKAVDDDRKLYASYLTNLGAAPAAAPADEAAEDGAAPAATEITNPLNYREVAKQLKAELDKRSADMVTLTADKQTQQQTIAANRAEDKAKIDAATTGQQTAQTELAGERDKFNTGKQEQQTQVTQLTEALGKKDEASKALDDELNKQILALKETDRKRGLDLTNMQQELVKTRPRQFETTDGKITAVLPRERLVYINLGSADNLRAQITFSVYGQDSAKLVETESKAEIEVTQISGPHSAIARILSDSRSDPILPGDAIFSPAYHPGSRVHFAIVGVTDIDKDGDSDRQRIRDLIATNGGVIDIEVDDDGNITGDNKPPEVTAATQYLIQGNPPSDEKVLAKYASVIGKAKETGTVVLTVQQFLNMVGYKSDERTVGLGRGADPRDFPPKASTSAYDKPGAAKFRERRPEAPAAK
jgi:hypothetical protein